MPSDLKTYYVKIKNSLSTRISGHLYVDDRSGKRIEIPVGSIYEDEATQKNPLSVQVYVKSLYCDIQKVGTITAEENPELITYDDSIYPPQCIPYTICLISSQIKGYTFGYLNINKTEPIKPISCTVSYSNNNPFSFQLHLISSPNCEDNYKLSIYNAAKNLNCKILGLNDVPNECQSDPDSYKVCFITDNLPNQYKLGYKVSNDPSGQIKPLTDDPIVDKDQFELTLYLISSPSNCSNIELGKFQSSKTFECVTLTESIIPDQCKLHYYVKLLNSITSREYSIYVKYRNNEYIEVEESYEDSSLTPFEADVYIKSSGCPSYSLADNGVFNSWTDPSLIEKIFDNNNGQIFYAAVKNELPSDYKLYVQNREGEKVEVIPGTPYKDQYTLPFEVSFYVTSPQCPTQTRSDVTIYCEFIDNDYFSFIESYVPSQYLKPATYEVCADLSSLSRNYEISYETSYEPGILIFEYGMNHIKYNHPFSVTTYLSKSLGCTDTVKLNTYNTSVDFQCISFTKDILPEECTAGDDSKGLSLPMILGIAGVGVLIIVIIVIVVVVVIKQRKKKMNQFVSTTMTSGLLKENNGNKNY